MTAFTVPKSVADVLLVESSTGLSRETGIIEINTTVAVGQVLGKKTTGTTTSAAKGGGNTGNGTLTMDASTPTLAGAKLGVYQVRFTAATTFMVIDPDGYVVGGGGIVGTTWSSKVKFQTAAGGTPWVAGDGFDLTVAAGNGNLVPISASALDGSAVPCSVALDAVASQATTAKIGTVARQAILAASGLAWNGLTTPQQNAAIAIMQANGLRVRASI